MDESKKFYSQKAISIATFFGGPLAAGYLIKKNYQAMEQPDLANKAMIIGVISTIILFAGIFSIPEHIIDKIPNALFPLIYTLIISLILEKKQGNVLRSHKEAGGEFHSGWKAAGVGSIAMVIIVAVVFLGVFLSDAQPDSVSSVYDSEIAKFVENENKALAVLDVMETSDNEHLTSELNKGLALWNENKEIVTKLNQIENLPSELLETNKNLLTYCDLRIELYEIILKSVAEDTDEYSLQLEQIVLKINNLLEQIN